MTYLLFAVALSLSAVAAWYAIAGLVAIFAAAAVPIMIMGSLLEVSKLTVASWIYRGWDEIPKLMKAYFLVALVILMGLTSMGIFGFLSKAHLDQAVPTGDAIAQLEIIDDKIKSQRENINVARTTIAQLDEQVNRFTELGAVTRGINARREQASERAILATSIEDSQTEISKLTQERIPLAQEIRKIEAEVGPIKYIAAVIYGDSSDSDLLESAVRFVMLMIVFVFDPLAVLMLVAANWQLKKDASKRTPKEIVGETKHIVIEDDFLVQEELKTTEQPVEPTASEIPEIEVEEHSKDWEPELYKRVKKCVEYDPAGRRITPALEEELHPPTKTESFLSKVQDSLSTGIRTIEKEVEELQRKK